LTLSLWEVNAAFGLVLTGITSLLAILKENELLMNYFLQNV